MKRTLFYPALLTGLVIVQSAAAAIERDTPQPIRPVRIEVGYTKTVHLLFPAPVTYIDIGSMDLLAGKADGAENVVRVKAAVRDFATETNLTVITEDGGFYTFDACYAENPAVSTLEIPASDPSPANEASAEGRVLLQEVGREKPATVKRMLSDIYRQNRQDLKGIRSKNTASRSRCAASTSPAT